MCIEYSNHTPRHLFHKNRNICLNKICTHLFQAALSAMVKTQKPLKYPTIHEWLKKKRWFRHAVKYYLAIKMNEPLTHVIA